MVIARGATPTILPPARTCTRSHGSTGRPSARLMAAYARMDTSGYWCLPFGRTGATRLGNPTLYLYTESRTEAFWARFEFRRVEGDAIPRDLRGSLRIARVATAVFSLVARARSRIVVMRRDER
jgi:hypothetical protein